MKHFLTTKDFSDLIQVEDVIYAIDELQVLFKEENIKSIKNFVKYIIDENMFLIDLNSDGEIKSCYYFTFDYYIKDDLLVLSVENMIPEVEKMNSIKNFKKILARQRFEL